MTAKFNLFLIFTTILLNWHIASSKKTEKVYRVQFDNEEKPRGLILSIDGKNAKFLDLERKEIDDRLLLHIKGLPRVIGKDEMKKRSRHCNNNDVDLPCDFYKVYYSTHWAGKKILLTWNVAVSRNVLYKVQLKDEKSPRIFKLLVGEKNSEGEKQPNKFVDLEGHEIDDCVLVRLKVGPLVEVIGYNDI